MLGLGNYGEARKEIAVSLATRPHQPEFIEFQSRLASQPVIVRGHIHCFRNRLSLAAFACDNLYLTRPITPFHGASIAHCATAGSFQ